MSKKISENKMVIAGDQFIGSINEKANDFINESRLLSISQDENVIELLNKFEIRILGMEKSLTVLEHNHQQELPSIKNELEACSITIEIQKNKITYLESAIDKQIDITKYLLQGQLIHLKKLILKELQNESRASSQHKSTSENGIRISRSNESNISVTNLQTSYAQALKSNTTLHDFNFKANNFKNQNILEQEEVISEVIINDCDDTEHIMDKLNKNKNLKNLKSVIIKGNNKITIKHANKELAQENLSFIQKKFLAPKSLSNENNQC